MVENPRLANKIGVLWSGAILAVAAGFTEWIIWRFTKQTRDPVFLQFVEATWAAVIDRRYLNHTSKDFDARIRKSYALPKNVQHLHTMWNFSHDYSDSLRGPQCVAVRILADVCDRTAPRDFGSMETVYVSNLVEQIIGSGEPFKSWRRGVITRFTKIYGSDATKKSWLGPPVPREALDLDTKFDPKMAPPLLNQFLSGLDHKKNPFLMSPDAMIKLGFEGTPYQYP